MFGLFNAAADIFTNGSVGFCRRMIGLGTAGILVEAIAEDMEDDYCYEEIHNQEVLRRIYERQEEVKRMMAEDKKRRKG